MRLDKFLKIARLIKRRTVAHEAASRDKITVNGKIAKPSKKVKIGDELAIHYYDRIVRIRIREIVASTKKEDAQAMYEIIKIDEKAVE